MSEKFVNTTRTYLWHRFEQCEAIATSPRGGSDADKEAQRANAMAVMEGVLEVGGAAETLTSDDIYEMRKLYENLLKK